MRKVISTCHAKNKKNGQSCGMPALKGKKWCYIHDPANGAKRAKTRKAGGTNRRVVHHGDSAAIPADIRSLADAVRILAYTLAEVIPMENSINRARVLIALFDAYVRAFEVGELEQRIAMLEGLQSPSSVFRRQKEKIDA